MDRFDPLFFKMTHDDACKMDPCGRLFLQEAIKAAARCGLCAVRRQRPEMGNIRLHQGGLRLGRLAGRADVGLCH